MTEPSLRMPDDRTLLRLFDAAFMQLSRKERLEVQLAITAFAYAYTQSDEARRQGITIEEYRQFVRELRQADAFGKKPFSGTDEIAGLEKLVALGGCVKQNDIPGQYAPTQIGDRAIMYTIGTALR